jgi:citronellol/citronellal dehydrogenase
VLPHLLESTSPRVLTLSPPINLDRTWLARHAPYAASKYAIDPHPRSGRQQYRDDGLFADCLWPETLIATAVVLNVVADKLSVRVSRRAEITAHAVAILLTRSADAGSGECDIAAELLRANGVIDLGRYAAVAGVPDEELERDLFL